MKNISVVIPAFDEEKRLGGTLEKWREFLKIGKSQYKIIEIIVVDDGSKDKTAEIAESFEKVLPIKIIKLTKNRGKGRAVKEGVFAALGDIIFVYDADAAVLPEEIDKLFSWIDAVDIVIGSRIAPGAEAELSFLRRVVGVCFHLFCLPLLPHIKDASCGAKLFDSAVAKKIFKSQKLERFAFDVEILLLAEKMNFKVKEIGLKWREAPGSKVKIIRDGIEMFFSVLTLYKYFFKKNL